MNVETKVLIVRKLRDYIEHEQATCRFECNTCRFGVSLDYGFTHQCSLEFVTDILDEEIYEDEDRMFHEQLEANMQKSFVELNKMK